MKGLRESVGICGKETDGRTPKSKPKTYRPLNLLLSASREGLYPMDFVSQSVI